MQIIIPVTDKTFLEQVVKQIDLVDKKKGLKFNSTDEISGAMSRKLEEIQAAIKIGNGLVTSEVLSKILDMTVTCVRSSRSCIHSK